jgi:hypothetical protein
MEKKLSDFGNYIINLNLKKKFFFLTIIIILKIGIWYHPALWKLLEISIDPFNNSAIANPYAHYLYYNFLGGFVANFFGFNTKITFFLFHLFFSITFFFLYVYFVFKKLSKKYATFSIVLFLALPVSTTSFFWVGYDSVTLTIMMISIIFRFYIPLVFIFGILLGLQHFELTFLAALSLLVLNIYNKFSFQYSYLNLNYSISIIIGILFGKFLLEYYFYQIGIDINSGRISYTSDYLKHFTYNAYFNFHNVIWFALSIGWLIIIRYFYFKDRNNLFLLIILGQLLILFIVDDTTRVYANLSFLIIFSQILVNKNFLQNIKNYEISILLFLWLIFPYGWAWQGVLRASMFTYDFAYFLNYFFNLFNNESINSSIIWPFKIIK